MELIVILLQKKNEFTISYEKGRVKEANTSTTVHMVPSFQGFEPYKLKNHDLKAWDRPKSVY